MSRAARARVAAGLASAFLAGEWMDADLARRGRAALGRRHRWLAPLAAQVVAAYQRPPRDRSRELADWIEVNKTFRRAWDRAPENGSRSFAGGRPSSRRWARCAGRSHHSRG
jgi:hypothetical protein